MTHTRLDLAWDADAPSGGTYRSKLATLGSVTSGSSSLTRYATTPGIAPVFTPEVADARQFEERLQQALRSRAFLALTVRARDVGVAEHALAERFQWSPAASRRC